MKVYERISSKVDMSLWLLLAKTLVTEFSTHESSPLRTDAARRDSSSSRTLCQPHFRREERRRRIGCHPCGGLPVTPITWIVVTSNRPAIRHP